MDKILITKDVMLASYAENSSIERIMVDLEVLGKKERQGHLDTVFSKHTYQDIFNVRSVLNKSKLMVRINPINSKTKEEIEKVISLGADIIMLPMFKTKAEVEKFIQIVNGRVKVCLLLETSQALVRIDDILSVNGIDEIHIGLNDLHLSMNLDFMFELLSGGIIEYLANKIKMKNIKFGFGGISRLGQGKLDSSLILSEHYRLGSSIVILSRDFKAYKEDYSTIISEINLKDEVNKINEFIASLRNTELEQNKIKLNYNVNKIVDLIKKGK